MEPIATQIRKNAVTNGLILGVISLIITLVIFYTMAGAGSLVVVGICGFLPWIIGIVLDVLFTRNLRKSIGGFWGFREAITGIFIMLMVSFLVSKIATDLYTQFIDTELMARTRDNVVSVQETFFANQGMDQDQADAALESTRKGFDSSINLTVSNLAKTYAIAILITFIFSLILAAIFKKERPLYETAELES